MPKIQIFTKWTYPVGLDSYICTEEDISDQGCVGYTGPIPTSLCCSMYNTCGTKCNTLSYLHRYEHKHKPPKHWWQHMHYVALSQVTTLSGLYLKNLNCEKICI